MTVRSAAGIFEVVEGSSQASTPRLSAASFSLTVEIMLLISSVVWLSSFASGVNSERSTSWNSFRAFRPF